MKISIIMPALNEERNIARSLDALSAQSFMKDGFDVLVLDNGSSDRTVAIAESYHDRLNIRVETRQGGNVASLRNHGAQQTTGEVLAFLDADCFPKHNWLAEVLRLRPANGVWGSDYVLPEDSTWVGKVWEEFQAKIHEGPTTFVPGGCLLVARRDFEILQGFQTSLETSEDVDFCLRAKAKGMHVLAMPSLAVAHAGTPRTLGHFFRKNRWHGKHVFRMFLSNLPETKYLPVVALSIYTLIMLFAVVIGLVLSITKHSPVAFLLCLVLLLLPSIGLAFARALPRRRPGAILPLFTLYFVYFLSRAASLIQMPARSDH
jgi:glycosyltransferase involved in cell wall biosynthesis